MSIFNWFGGDSAPEDNHENLSDLALTEITDHSVSNYIVPTGSDVVDIVDLNSQTVDVTVDEPVPDEDLGFFGWFK